MATIDEALRLAEAAPTVREAAAVLRQQLAPLRVMVVDAFDMRGEAPLAQGTRRVLWGAASDGHCWSVSSDAGAIAGLYLADL
jgi:hypothetical protein